MNAKEKVDALQFLATTHRSEFENRRKIEWRVITLCLTFYVLALALRYKGGFAMPRWARVICGIVFIAIAITTVVFSLLIHRAHATNKRISQNAEDAILKLLNGEDPGEIRLFRGAVDRPSLTTLISGGGAGVYGWWCQSAIVILLAIACMILFVS